MGSELGPGKSRFSELLLSEGFQHHGEENMVNKLLHKSPALSRAGVGIVLPTGL